MGSKIINLMIWALLATNIGHHVSAIRGGHKSSSTILNDDRDGLLPQYNTKSRFLKQENKNKNQDKDNKDKNSKNNGNNKDNKSDESKDNNSKYNNNQSKDKNNSETSSGTSSKQCNLLNSDWSELSTNVRNSAVLLGYDECSWEHHPFNNDIEYLSWSSLSSAQKSYAYILQCDQESWDRNVNHFHGYSWDEMIKLDITYYDDLGYDKSSWELGADAPESSLLWFRNLSKKQQEAATNAGYTQNTWNSEYFCETAVNWNYRLKDTSASGGCVMKKRDGNGDRLENALSLNAGEYICSTSGQFKFGINSSGDFVLEEWQNSRMIGKVTYFEGQQSYKLALTKDAAFVVYDGNRQPVWTLPSIDEVHFSDTCLYPPYGPNMHCPYLHLHNTGIVVLNYLNNGFDDDSNWVDTRIQYMYDWGTGSVTGQTFQNQGWKRYLS